MPIVTCPVVPAKSWVNVKVSEEIRSVPCPNTLNLIKLGKLEIVIFLDDKSTVLMIMSLGSQLAINS